MTTRETKIVVDKSQKKNEITLSKQINPLVEKAQNLSIDSKTITEATELLSQCNTFLKNLTTEKEKLTKPINEALKEIRSRYKPAEDILNETISTLRSGMSAYQTEALRIKKEEEDKIAARIGEGKGHIKIDTAIEKISNLSSPSKSVQTDQGSVSFRTDQKLKITNPLTIPREYLLIDERSLLSALKRGLSIPGAEIELIQTPINRRV